MNQHSHIAAVAELNALMIAGASALDVASFVRTMLETDDYRIGIRLSHMIEDQAADGTFAEEVFNILAD